jgi:hypothetical protein
MDDFPNKFLELLSCAKGVLTKRFFEDVLYSFEREEEVEFIRWFKPMVAHMRLIDPEIVQVFFEEYFPRFEEMLKLKNSNLYLHD